MLGALVDVDTSRVLGVATLDQWAEYAMDPTAGIRVGNRSARITGSGLHVTHDPTSGDGHQSWVITHQHRIRYVTRAEDGSVRVFGADHNPETTAPLPGLHEAFVLAGKSLLSG